MMDGGVEIREIADLRRDRIFRFRLRNEATLQCRLQRRAFEQSLEHRAPRKRSPTFRTELHQIIERRTRACAHRVCRVAAEAPGSLHGGKVEDLIADRNSAAKLFARVLADETRQSADFESENRRPRILCRCHPALAIRVVRRIRLAHRSDFSAGSGQSAFSVLPAIHVIPLQRRTALSAWRGVGSRCGSRT